MTIPFAKSSRLATLLRSGTAAWLLAPLWLLGAGTAVGAEGSLATATWPGAGFAATTTIPGASGSVGQAVAVQADGNVVVAGYATVSGSSELVLARYLTTGGLDPSFGSGGIVVDATLTPSDKGYYLAVQASGAIDVAGYQTASGNNVAAVVQYTASGARDASFGTGGLAAPLTSLPFAATSTNVVINGMVLQPDGKLVCVGTFWDTVNSRFSAMVVRYTVSGSLDTSFGASGGVAIRPSIGTFIGNVFGNHVVLQSDGSILGCGTANESINMMMMFRVTSGGIIDTGYGSNGVQTVQFPQGASFGYFIDVQADGKSVTGGSVGSPLRFAAARLTTDGQLDSSYGSGGMVVLPAFAAGATAEESTALAVQWNGLAVLYGYSQNGSISLAVARLTAAGALDPTFGTGGQTLTAGAFGVTNGAAITAQTTGGVAGPNPNHQLVVTGSESNNLFAARYILDTTAPVTAITAPATGAATNDQTPAVSGTSEPYASVSVFADGAAAGSATASATGTWTLAGTTITLAQGTHSLTASALDAAGNTGALSAPVTVNINLIPPTIVSAVPVALSTSASPMTFTVTFSEPVASFTASQLGLSNASDATTTSTGNGTVWTIAVIPGSAGIVTVTIPAGSARDTAGNASTGTASVSAQYTGSGGVATTGGGTTATPSGFIDNGGSSHSKCGLGGGLMGALVMLFALRRRSRRAA